MENALKTLFYPYTLGALSAPGGDDACLFLNAQPYAFCNDLNITGVQLFKPHAAAWEKSGKSLIHSDTEDLDDVFSGEVSAAYDVVYALLPKNKVEAAYWVAYGLSALKEGGLLVCAADNKAGGAQLLKLIKGFGCVDVEQESKHKSRVVWLRKGSEMKVDVIDDALQAGSERVVLNGAYQSWPGVYGWDKIDRGSALLAQNLPDDLSGIGADFGCGYGYLSRQIAEKSEGANGSVEELDVIDAELRAVWCTSRNLKDVRFDVNPLWLDLTVHQAELSGRYDFIVMNPPFHEGKQADSSIGKAFIERASESLKSGGRLFMVANTHLPYEQGLKYMFSSFENIHTSDGFKVIAAVK